MVTNDVLLLRLVLALLLGGIIGIERELVHRPAGIRTHMLVCLGAALFAIITMQVLPNEVGRIISGVATGIGFLGAGTIFMAKHEVQGLTTAASVWAVSAVGLGVGLGYYFVTVVSSVLILITLHLNRLEFFRNI